MRALLITAALASAILSAAQGAPLSLPHAAHPDRVREAFLGFVHRHGKEYVNDETEMKYRMGVFAENLAAIEESNAVNTFYSEVNEFADETWEEFSARLWTRHSHHHHHHQEQPHCNPKPDGQSPSPAGRHHHHHHHHRRRRYPESRDWRDLGVVSPVKNQGRCGSCWTFSATGALEAAYALEFGSILSLSEQQILDCAVAFDNWGCSGGWPQHAMAYVKFNGGIDLEASPRVSYPYLGHNGTSCEYKPEAAAVFVEKVVNITEGDEAAMMEAVGNAGPVSVSFEVVPAFRFYKNGTFTSNKCRKGADTLNHAVLAVGYDTKDDYWIIKNSWGKEWGMDGYFRMGPIGENMCGVSTCSTYPVLASP